VTTWFTSDLHIDHPFIAGNRGFAYLRAHDRAMMDGWNNNVKPGDNVVVCGDLFWPQWNPYTKAVWDVLNGSKVMIKGNHDRFLKKAKIPFKRIYNKSYKRDGKFYKHIVASHYPLRSWNRKRHGAIHVHGHCHAKLTPHWRMLDVGVDSAKILLGEWRPFSLEEVVYLTTYTSNAYVERKGY